MKSSPLKYALKEETSAWHTSSICINISYVLPLLCHFVNPVLRHLFFLLVFACLGENRYLHIRYTPKMLGVTSVFQKPFPFPFRGSTA